MPDFTCFLAKVGNVQQELPDKLTEFGARTIVDIFRDASSGQIELHVNDGWLTEPINRQKNKISALRLHKALAKVTQNPVDAERVNNIAVFFCPRYTYDDSVFGVMFDRGRVTEDDGNNSYRYMDVPREGCAVFVDAIASARPETFEEELGFTIVHELGHVFNRQHSVDDSFMAEDQIVNTSNVAAYDFNETDRKALSEIEADDNVYPGGSKFADQASSFRDVGTQSDQVQISVVAPKVQVYDPVELDLVVTSKDGVLLNRFDPGYREFNIWIQRGTGEPFAYQSNEHYCAYPKLLTTKNQFSRDIYLAMDGRGFLFDQAGEYQIWATYDDQNTGNHIKSNILELEVIGHEARHPILLSRWYWDLMRYKETAVLNRLDDLDTLNWMGNDAVSAATEYAIIRSTPTLSRLSERVHRLIQNPALGDHRRSRCEIILDAIQDRVG